VGPLRAPGPILVKTELAGSVLLAEFRAIAVLMAADNNLVLIGSAEIRQQT